MKEINNKSGARRETVHEYRLGIEKEMIKESKGSSKAASAKYISEES